MKVVDWKKVDFSDNKVSGIIVQYPNTEGTVEDYSQLVSSAHANGVSVYARVNIISSLLSITRVSQIAETICKSQQTRLLVNDATIRSNSMTLLTFLTDHVSCPRFSEA